LHPASVHLLLAQVGLQDTDAHVADRLDRRFHVCRVRHEIIAEQRFTAGCSEGGPHRMMHIRGLHEGSVRSAEVASSCGRVSIYATRCQMPGGEEWLSREPRTRLTGSEKAIAQTER
jgi:hypothetical protein